MTKLEKPQGPAAVLALMTRAIEKGIPAETMESLQRMYHAEQDRAAALEFAQALRRFQDECPPIPRTTHVKYVTKSGVTVDYRSADFEQIMETTRGPLHFNGFSVSFDMKADVNGLVTATVTLRHVNGHAVQSSATIPSASNNPGMSEQQKWGSANTFAKRTTLTSVLGLSLTDPEDEATDPSPITEEQAATLEALLEKAKADKARFLIHFGIKGLSDLRQTQYGEATRMLERKRRSVT